MSRGDGNRNGFAFAGALIAGFASATSYTNHAPLAPALMSEFHFSQALAGFLTTGLFLSHASMQIPGGHLVDRLGPRRVMAVALSIVCVGNFAIAFSIAYWQLILWKIFTGVGTGTCFVAGARYLAARFTGARLQVAQGFFGGAILMGSGFVIFAVPQLLAALGWRGAFRTTAMLVAAALAFWMLAAPPSKAPAHPPGSFLSMVGNPQLWLLGLVQMASFGLVIVMSAWVSLLLRQSLGLSASKAGMVGSVALLLGIVTRPSGGVLVTRTGVRPLVAGSLILAASGCFLLSAATSIAAAVAGVLIAGIGCGLPFPALFNRAAGLYPGRAGAAMGLVNGLGIVMILAGAPLVGRVADWSGSFRSSFTALGIFALVASIASFRIAET